jgi:hypothetical protein
VKEALTEFAENRRDIKSIVIDMQGKKAISLIKEYKESLKSGELESDLYLYNYWQEPELYNKLNIGIGKFLDGLQLDYLRHPRILMWANQLITHSFCKESEIEALAMKTFSLQQGKDLVNHLKFDVTPILLVLLFKYSQKVSINMMKDSDLNDM